MVGDCNQTKAMEPIIGVYRTASYWLEMREMSGEWYQLCVYMGVDVIIPSIQRQY